MPTLASSPYKLTAITRGRPTSSLPPPLPPKAIDLNSSTRSTDKQTGLKITRRAFLCDVVIETEGEETSALLNHLGRPLAPLTTLPAPIASSSSCPPSPLRHVAIAEDNISGGSRAEGSLQEKTESSQRMAQLIEELVRTERSYLSRIRALKESYADKLRAYARDPSQIIIPLYETKALFANIDNIASANAAFSIDLEEISDRGDAELNIGDICLKHFKDLRTFEPYRTYLSKQDESQRMLQDVLKKFPSFAIFIERTKYQTTGVGNIGLRELLMEPVQRIPRYTLLWHSMIKCMSPLSGQRSKLLEAVDIASRIAKCEPDPQTVRATVMYCLERSVEGFPANLFSNNRDFIDSIDVEDLPADYPTASSHQVRPRSNSRPMSLTSISTSASIPSLASVASTASSSQLATSLTSNGGSALPALHCTLFLFDDKLMIVKRQSHSISGRKVTGLDDVQKLVKTGGGVAVIDKNGGKKDKLSFRGLVDVSDVIASDIGNGDFHLFFERPPANHSDRWSARPFRHFSTVHPPFELSMDPIATKKEKLRFVENLWSAQALARARHSRNEPRSIPRVLRHDEETGLERAGEMFGRACCYWNVWDRRGWSAGTRKAKVAIHVDEDGSATELPMAEDSGPCMVIRLQPMTGGLCRFSHTTIDEENLERTVVDFNEVVEKIATTVHRYGIFKFRTSASSAPTTPSSTAHRLRPSMLNLDTISRNLFGTGSVSSRSHSNSASGTDTFGTSSTKMSRSVLSRTSTMEASSRLSVQTRSTSSEDLKKGHSRPSRSPSSEHLAESELITGRPYSANGLAGMGQSEMDLNERLNTARKNSKSTAALSPKPSGARKLGSKSVAELRSQVETSQSNQADGSLKEILLGSSPTAMSPTAPLRVRNESPSPSQTFPFNRDFWTANDQPKPAAVEVLSPRSISVIDAIVDPVLATSPQQECESLPRSTTTPTTVPLSPRPSGPRSPLPKAQIITPGLSSAHTRLRVVSGGGRRVSAGRETVPLKGDENVSPSQNTPPTIHISGKRQHSEDQLQSRKRSLSRSPLEPRLSDPSQILPDPLKVPSLSKRPGSRRSSAQQTPRKPSDPLTTPRTVSSGNVSLVPVVTGTTADYKTEHLDVHAAIEATRQRIAESRATTKRVKSEVHGLCKQLSKESIGRDRTARLDGNPSLPRSPHRRHINRLVDLDPCNQSSVSSQNSTASRTSKYEFDSIVMDECARGISSLVDRLDGHLNQAMADCDKAAAMARRSVEDGIQKTNQVDRLQAQVQRAKDQQDLLKQQLANVQVEMDVIYEAFNTELDGMFNDTNLPSTEAFEAMRRDLQLAKAKRNELALDNLKLKRDLEEANQKRDQWAQLLRGQEIIS